MPVESIRGRGATRNTTPTRFNLNERAIDGDWLDSVEALDGVPKRRTTVTIEHRWGGYDPYDPLTIIAIAVSAGVVWYKLKR